jgi:hypothetical protein
MVAAASDNEQGPIEDAFCERVIAHTNSVLCGCRLVSGRLRLFKFFRLAWAAY